MKTGRRLVACVSVLLLCGLFVPGRLSASSDHPGGEPQLRVVICDRVGMRASELNVAGREFSRILRSAGISVSLDYFSDSNPAGARTQAGCTIPVHLEGRYFQVVLVSEAPYTLSGNALGYAVGGAQPRAVVSINRARNFVERHWSGTQGDLPILIGHVMAHELGHLLLPSRPHTAFGIMSTGWGVQQAAGAASGTLLFVGDEARAIQKGLLQPFRISGN